MRREEGGGFERGDPLRMFGITRGRRVTRAACVGSIICCELVSGNRWWLYAGGNFMYFCFMFHKTDLLSSIRPPCAHVDSLFRLNERTD
jgi:hypothetical protein